MDEREDLFYKYVRKEIIIMYLPLRFLEQIDNYISLPQSKHLESVVNDKSIQFIKELIDNKRNFIFETYAYMKEYLTGGDYGPLTEEDVKEWINICDSYRRRIKIELNLDEDFLNLILFTTIRNYWRINKLVYRVEKDLLKTLTEMKSGKVASSECLTHTPAQCFYIDWENNDLFTDNGKVEGCIININKSSNNIVVSAILLSNGKRCQTTIVSSGVVEGINNEQNLFLTTDKDAHEEVFIENEEFSFTFYERKFKRFVFNFLIYLYAVNNDVETSVKTKDTYRQRKQSSEPKNKFKEINGFDVGFRYANLKREKIKYEHTEERKVTTDHIKGTPKSTHYRSAHWHTYWTLVDGKRTLIVKWVDGVMVNGGESENISVKRVK